MKVLNHFPYRKERASQSSSLMFDSIPSTDIEDLIKEEI